MTASITLRPAAAFLVATSVPRTGPRQAGVSHCRQTVSMQAKKAKKPRSNKTPQRAAMSEESKQSIDEMAKRIGIEVPREGAALDRKFETQEPIEERGVTFYQALAGLFGVETLDRIESLVYVMLGVLLLSFIATGLAISSEAFFKATSQPIPEALDNFAAVAGKTFTPVLLVFLALSSFFGVYKQSQLESGAAQYDETRSRRK